MGDWILIRFPREETGKERKLSRPWHGPYRITECRTPDVTAIKVHCPQDGPIQVHQMRVTPCPVEFPAGYYWYGNKQVGPGRPPKWVERLLSAEKISESTSPSGHLPLNPEGIIPQKASSAKDMSAIPGI